MQYNIYVYELSNGKYLLYPRVISNYDNFCAGEVAFVYQEIVKNNPIKRLVHTQERLESWQIDAFVHSYMHIHGIENVRGGRYNTLELSEKEEISQAIKYFTHGVEEQEQRVYQYYEYINTIAYEPDNYREKINYYEKTNLERKRFEIDRTIIYDLNWLVRIIVTGVDKFFEISDEYYKLMEQLSLIYNQYLSVFEDAQSKIDGLCKDSDVCNLFFEKPYVFFDKRVIKRERDLNNYDFKSDKQLEQVIKVFELAIYSLINREEELYFDLNQVTLRESKDKLFILENQIN
jgi:hypothetical protein